MRDWPPGVILSCWVWLSGAPSPNALPPSPLSQTVSGAGFALFFVAVDLALLLVLVALLSGKHLPTDLAPRIGHVRRSRPRYGMDIRIGRI
jgi:hypothetical protein